MIWLSIFINIKLPTAQHAQPKGLQNHERQSIIFYCAAFLLTACKVLHCGMLGQQRPIVSLHASNFANTGHLKATASIQTVANTGHLNNISSFCYCQYRLLVANTGHLSYVSTWTVSFFLTFVSKGNTSFDWKKRFFKRQPTC